MQSWIGGRLDELMMRLNFDPDDQAEFAAKNERRQAAETNAFIKRKAEQQRALEELQNGVNRQMEHTGDA
jgi:hypothetical protein